MLCWMWCFFEDSTVAMVMHQFFLSAWIRLLKLQV